MTNSIDFILTNTAYELISKVLSGKTLNFTKMAVGDGFSYDTTAAKSYTALVNEVLSLDITKKETLSASSVKVTSAFKNTDAQKEFYYREVGLYAQDPDTGEEVLYAYGNRNDAAELITPSGSGVVTKQLVFIVAVGDSANVTFNVNVDVYALQEDMIEAQADINKIQTDLSTAQTNISSLQTGLNQANTNVIALQTNKADKNFVNTGMITNCLLEVPQRVKYDLIDGTLTINAGSVVIIPYGTEDKTSEFPVGSTFLHENYKVYDTQFNNGNFFVWAELQNNVIQKNTTTDKNLRFVVLNIKGNGISTNQGSISGENPTTTETWQLVYNTATNLIGSNTSNTTISYSTDVKSFPLMLSQADGSVMHGSIPQVFNGIGYIGKTFWVDKGVKGLSPNGLNSNGTLNNTEWEYTSLYIRTMQNETDIHFIGLNGFDISRINTVGSHYDPEINLNLLRINEKWSYTFYCKCIMTDGIISDLEPIKPFRILDYYVFQRKINELESRISALESI